MDYYHHPASPNCRKVSAVLAHLGIEAAHHLVDLPKGEQQTPEFLAINPNGRVPALVDGDLKLWESNSIVIYLAEKAGGELWPEAHRLDILKWMFWEQAHLMFATGVPFFQRILQPILGGEPDEAKIEEAIGRFRRLAKVLDDHLSDRLQLVGDSLSLADFAVAGNFSFADQTGLPMADFPNVARWLAALDEVPAWKASEPRFG